MKINHSVNALFLMVSLAFSAFSLELVLQNQQPTPAPGDLTFVEQQGVETVHRFFQVWLKERDPQKALGFTDDRLMDNKYLLTDDFLGEWQINHQSDSGETKREILRAVLKEVAETVVSGEPAQVFSIDRISDAEVEAGTRILNHPRKDGFLAVALDENWDNLHMNETPEQVKYLKEMFPSEKYIGSVAVIQIRDRQTKEKTEAGMYFVWRYLKGEWKVILLGLYGM